MTKKLKFKTYTDPQFEKKILPGKHKSIRYLNSGTEVIGDWCNGDLIWDEGLEGYCCNKCHANTSIK